MDLTVFVRIDVRPSGHSFMYASLIALILLVFSQLAPLSVQAETADALHFEVERRLLRMAPESPSDITTALQSQDWKAVQDFGVHGYDNNIYWLHLNITATHSAPQHLVVQTLYPLHDKIDFYLYQEETPLQHWAMGDTQTNPGWVYPDKNFAIPVALTQGESRQIFIRIESSNTKMLKTSVITNIQMQESIHWNRLIFGAIYGIMLAMALYNLIIGLFVRDAAYTLYACQVAFFCLFIMTINGDGRYYLWRDYADFNQYAIQMFGVLYVFFIILFPWYLLKLNRYLPSVRPVFYCLAAVEVLFAISVLVLPYDASMKIAVAVSMLLSPALLCVGLYLVYRRVPISGIYTFAWSFYLVGATLVGLAAANIVEMNMFTLNGGAIGGIIEQVLLSVALAKRIEVARKEKFTALQRAAESNYEAEKQKRNFQGLFERAPVGIVTLNETGDVTTINPKCCELLGFESAQHANSLDLKFIDRFSTVKQIQKNTQSNGRVIDHETKVLTLFGESKYCAISLIKQDVGGVIAYEGYITDISERKKAQKVLQIMEDERMSSLEQLVTGVAHEINTPLGVNLTTISYSKEELGDLDTQFKSGTLTKGRITEYINNAHDAFDLMQKSLSQISTLVNKFKQVSFKHVSLEKKNLVLKNLLISIFDRSLGGHPNVTFDLDVAEGDFYDVYPDLLDIILTQLIENSLIHGFQNTNEGNIHLYMRTENNRLIMEYSDSGVGVSEQLKPQIFNPFVTSARGNADRAGLGLYRIHNLVVQVLKGNITLLDAPSFAVRIDMEL